jgi:hypothetical protein
MPNAKQTKKATPTAVFLTYLVPLIVEVRNDQDGRGPYIESVHVDDEGPIGDHNRHSVTNDAGQTLATTGDDVDPAVPEAIKFVQENDHEDWPAWRFGR